MDDDLIKALSSELPTPSVRPDAVHLISGAIVATRRRRARAAIIGSVAAVAIVVTVIAGTVTNLATPDPGPAQPTPTASPTSVSRTGSSVSPTSGSRPAVSSTQPLVPPVTPPPSRTGPAKATGATTHAGSTAQLNAPVGVGTGGAADPGSNTTGANTTGASTTGASTTSSSTTGSSTTGSLTTEHSTFTTPSGNITCVDSDQVGGISCFTTTIDFAARAVVGCESWLWGHVVLLSATVDAFSCPYHVAPPAGIVLPYGTTNVSAHATCVSQESGLTCTRKDGSGDGFVLNRSAVQFLSHGVAVEGPSGPDTVVHNYQPWSGAAVAAGITVDSHLTATCTNHALTSGRSDARRCVSGSFDYDPCFVSPAGGQHALCPTDRPDHVVELDQIGVSTPAGSGFNFTAWAVQTPDGQFCAAMTGGENANLAGDQVYGCPDGRKVVADPIQGAGVWLANYFSADSTPATAGGQTIHLAQVWE